MQQPNTHNALLVTLSGDTQAASFMTSLGWIGLPAIPQLPRYLFWYGFSVADSVIATTQNSPHVFASLLLP